MKGIWESGPVRFIREMVDIYFGKRVSRSAAELAYFLILTFFPILVCINGFIGILHLDSFAVMAAMEDFLPKEALSVVGEYIGYISTNQSNAMLIAGITMTLFSASAAFRALMNIMDDIYERKSYTGLWQIVASVIFSILFLVTIYLSIVVVLTGNWLFALIEGFFHLDPSALPWDWQWLRFLILFALVLLFVLLAYRMAAPRGKPRPPILTGGIIAAAALVAASILFSWFIGMSSKYSLVYGSLASVIILLLWLYLCGNILILGNVFNCVWYKRKKIRYLKKLKKESGPPEQLGG
ncbi:MULTISPECIES: YihY/virulence factor BrkB family protein [Oscillospiraceae]|uniref:YihY/virulence factor BrkB family protein n=1 Tax=Lawsonibacter faecis TaxID=2763052 RepID=A0A8J6MCC2_9FIRM|nr:YihY/virulence factor BrkB family protein [Bacteroides thetaiotaomicron]MBC5736610.1 YihY/virulence factor BrkB family protein [Lawsonibacter faecis]MCQ4865271.1 YihY/virulence factor BrkB family protein [Pseudoflavonifractor phocaeensis]MTQ97697.1 YihY family inner membrane protein [Pseudoflavonifractor sp. BIOML-A16]MTR07401.1 YihY family inner membrane protein [Pseudoflavonifractor sp. BIOML-A15]MTR14803.1 YihY family inner membrane protein [Pseudoflavonifractor sp. BIOML-A17]MTR20865.1